MKTLILTVLVPDDIQPSQIRITYPGIFPNLNAGFKVVKMPTDEEMKNAFTPEYDERPERMKRAYKIQGANWLKSQILEP